MDTPTNTSPSPNHDELRAWVQSNRTFLDLLLDSFVVVDTQNQVVDFNVAFTELCGETYRKILKIKDFCALLKTEHCPHQCPGRQVLEAKKLVRLDEIKAASKLQEELSLIIAGIPILNPAGELMGAVVTIRNVSAESELQKKYHQRKEESATDGLTKLYNKVYTEQMLERFIKMAERSGKPLSLMMCDIDHFKKVNDTYGHQAGDHVLRIVSSLLQAESRGSDVVGRFGGEEFMTLLPETEMNGVVSLGERFRKIVEATEIIFEDKKIPVTVSLGSSVLDPAANAGLEASAKAKKLIAEADTALYFSKRNGRNQLSLFQNLPSEAKQSLHEVAEARVAKAKK